MKRADGRTVAGIFLFVVLFNVALFTATAVLHEAGHALYGVLSGCTDVRIVLLDVDTGTMFTRMQCAGSLDDALLGVSGFLLIVPFAGLLRSLTLFEERFGAWIVLGASLLGSGADIAHLAATPWLRYAVVVSGILLIIRGEDQFITAIIQEKTPDIAEIAARRQDQKAEDARDTHDDDTADTADGDDPGRHPGSGSTPVPEDADDA